MAIVSPTPAQRAGLLNVALSGLSPDFLKMLHSAQGAAMLHCYRAVHLISYLPLAFFNSTSSVHVPSMGVIFPVSPLTLPSVPSPLSRSSPLGSRSTHRIVPEETFALIFTRVFFIDSFTGSSYLFTSVLLSKLWDSFIVELADCR
jgi:hypothetical protein